MASNLVILDFQLGDGNGGEICRELKPKTKNCHVKVLMLKPSVSYLQRLPVMLKKG